jgi:hypothetical protein
MNQAGLCVVGTSSHDFALRSDRGLRYRGDENRQYQHAEGKEVQPSSSILKFESYQAARSSL